ncbi:unnamed protein product [Knipowitschia caucasica]
MADKKSFQMCNCCGWSKMTTYQGLRTHQGKMGCTPKGTTIPERTQQVIFNTFLPKFTYTLPLDQQITEDIMRVWRQMDLPGQMLDTATVTEIQNEQFPGVLSPLASNQVFPTGNIQRFALPAASTGFSQEKTFGPTSNDTETERAKENKPKTQTQSVFGSSQRPLQLSDQNIKTHSALDSMIRTQQTQKSHRSPALADVVRTERENSASIATTHPTTSQPIVSGFCTSTQPQTVFSLSTQQTPKLQSAVTSADVVKHGQTSTAFSGSRPSHQTQSFQSAVTSGVNNETTTLFSRLGTTTSNFGNQKPAVFDGPWCSQQTQSFQGRPDTPADVMDGKETKPGFSTTLTSTSHVGNNNQTQAAFSGSAGPQTQSFHSAVTSAVKDETTTLFSGLGTTLPSFSNFGNQKPAVFDWPWRSQQGRPDTPADVMDRGEATPGFSTTLTSTSHVGNNNQTQAAFSGSAGPQMFQLSTQIPGPFQTQPTATHTMPPADDPTSSFLGNLLISNGTLTGSSSGPSSSAAEASVKVEDKQNTGGVQQQQIEYFQTQPGFAQFQKTSSQTLSSQQGPRKTEQVSTMTPSTTASTGAPQSGQSDLQTGPATLQAAPPQEPNPYFETPPPNSHPSTAEGNKTRRTLDFSTGAHQAKTSLTVPTTTARTQLPLVDDQREREAEKLNQLQRDQIKAELQQKIRSREQKLCEIRASVKECKGSLDAEWLEIDSVFSGVIHIVEEARQRALQPLENRREKLKRESQSLIQKIQEDILKLEKAIKETETATDLDIVPLPKIRTRDTQHNINTTFSFGPIQTTISSMVEQIQEELGKISALELERVRAFEGRSSFC